jgi:hypothetical protein
MQPTPVTVSAVHPSGFTIALQMDLQDLDTTLADLLARGYRPTSGSADGWQRTAEGLPICSKHRVPMRQREKQGDSWYSHSLTDHRTGQPLYCRGYRSPTLSPGWELPGEHEAHP